MSNTTFNTSPYFDDYDSSKGFHSILYRADRPVQVRELNQSQSIIKNQIEKFGNHIFKNGSKVSNGRITLSKIPFIVINQIVTTDFLKEGTLLTSKNTNFKAEVLFFDVQRDLSIKIYFNKISSGTNSETNFIKGESITILEINSGSTVNASIINLDTFTGTSDVFVVDEGIFYHSGYFIETQKQHITLNDFIGLNKDFKIGLNLIEEIITSTDDSTLYDNTLGYSNQGAPGADRYKLSLVLGVKSYDYSDINFITLGNIISDAITILPEDTQYSELLDTLAKRTYEESGNYVVENFVPEIYEDFSYSNIDNLSSLSGDKDKLKLKLTSGFGYVKGYRVDSKNTLPATIQKAGTINYDNYLSRVDAKAYILAKPFIGKKFASVVDLNTNIFDYQVISIYDGPINAGIPTGTLIGTCLLYDANYISGTFGLDAVYSYKILKLNLNNGKKVSDIKSYYNSTIKFAVNAVLDLNDFSQHQIYNSDNANLIYDLGVANIKSLKDLADHLLSSITLTYRKKFAGILSSTGTITFNSSINESFNAFSSSTICYVYTGTTYTIIDLTGKCTIQSNSISINLTNSYANYTIVLFHDTTKNNFAEKKKTLNSYTKTYTLTSQNIIDVKSNTGLALLHADAVKVSNVKYYTSNPNDFKDYTLSTILHKNDTEYSYELSSVQIANSAFIANVGDILEVTYYYFQHSSDAGFFSINSYDSALTDFPNIFDRSKIGTFTTKNGKTFDLTQCLDFRCLYTVTENICLKNESDIVSDIQFFAPRKDLVAIDQDSNLVIIQGSTSLNPEAPKQSESYLNLFELYIPAVLYTLNDLQFKRIETKRYTMKDIQTLESRISNVEYYAALTQLESSIINLSTKDVSGLDRFKNGFLTDNFSSFTTGDVTNLEYRCSLDIKGRELRPQFDVMYCELEFDEANSIGFKKDGDIVSLDYTSEIVNASDIISATSDIAIAVFSNTKKQGILTIQNNINTWYDTTQPISINNKTVDLTLGSNDTKIGMLFGNWVINDKSVVDLNNLEIINSGLGSSNKAYLVNSTQTSTNNQTSTTTTQVPSQNVSLNTKSNTYISTDFVTSVSAISYIPKTTLVCTLTGLRPFTRLYAFFDDKNVTLRCFKSTSNALKNLVTDSLGNLNFTFEIDAGVYFNGDKILRLSDSSTNNQSEEENFAEAYYFSSGLSLNKASDKVNILYSGLSTTNSSLSVTVNDSAVVQLPKLPPCDSQPQFSPPVANVNVCNDTSYPASITFEGKLYNRIAKTVLYKRDGFDRYIMNVLTPDFFQIVQYNPESGPSLYKGITTKLTANMAVEASIKIYRETVAGNIRNENQLQLAIANDYDAYMNLIYDKISSVSLTSGMTFPYTKEALKEIFNNAAAIKDLVQLIQLASFTNVGYNSQYEITTFTDMEVFTFLIILDEYAK